MPTIREAIQQSTFESPRQRVLINLLYSAGWAKSGSAAALRPSGLTWQQFNCLRILRGQRGRPAPMRLIAERMLDPQSNASRLVDKLVAKGFVERVACPDDRRQVRVTLTAAGGEVLDEASAAVRSYYGTLGTELSDEDLSLLSDLLDRFRRSACPPSDGEPGGGVESS